MSSEQKIRLRDLVLIGFSVLVIYGGLRVLGIVVDSMTETSSLDEIPVVTAGPPSVIQEAAPATDVPVEAVPTETPPPEVNKFFTVDFGGDLSSWQPYTALGEDSQVERTIEDGKVVFHLSPSNDTIPITYIYNADLTYADVRLDMVTTNNGNNANDVGLVCRFTGNTWYEFDVSNSEVYSIYAVDLEGAVQKGFNELTSGISTSITSGHATNTYTAVCKGNELSLFVNGDSVTTIQDTTFNFTEGNIGFGVSGRQALPIDVSIDSLTISEP